MRSPPSIAPYTDPMPPRMTAANTTSRMLKPIRGSSWRTRKEDAAGGGQGAADNPHDENDAVSSNTALACKVVVVGRRAHLPLKRRPLEQEMQAGDEYRPRRP